MFRMRCPAGRWSLAVLVLQVEAGVLPPRAARRERLKAEIARLFKQREGKERSPRVTAALRDTCWRVSENTVAGLMREQGLAARATKRRKGTTRPGRGRWRAEDLVKRKFAAGGINHRCTATVPRSLPGRESCTWTACWT